MRQLQDISAWQEYGGRRRRETSQQQLSVHGDGWKAPDTCSSTSEEPRAPRRGSNSLCTSWTVMTTLPIKKPCSALVHLKSHCSESTHLDIRKVPFYRYFGKESKTVSFVTSLWKKNSCLSPRRMNQQRNTLLQNIFKHTQKRVGELCPRRLLCWLFVRETHLAEDVQAMFFFHVLVAERKPWPPQVDLLQRAEEH